MIEILIFGVAALAVLAFVLIQNGRTRHVRRRLAQLVGKTAKALQTRSSATVVLRREVADSSIGTLDKLIKRLLPRPAKLRDRLAATGRRIALAEYLLASLLVAMLSCFLLTAWGTLSLPTALLASLALGVALPYKYVGSMIARRQKKFLALFSEAVELMVRGLKSGIPVSESIRVVGQELPDPVGFEFRSMTDAMVLGQSFDEALAAVSRRIALPEFRFFVISLGIQQETGGNLSETLENLAIILRRRRQMKQKIHALSSEARASAYIIGSLPFLMFIALAVLSPQYVHILLGDPRGHMVLAAAIGSMGLGVGIMIRMGKFQI